METSLLTQWFSGPETKAICWTLIHSLWIGMIIALFAGLVILFTRKSAANLRYRLLCGILVFFVLSVSVIFFIEVRTTGAVQTNPNNVKLLINPVNINIADHGFATPQVSPVKVVINFLDSYVSIIFMIWLLFFMMKSLKMVGGLLYIQRIRNYKVHDVSEEFKDKIALFSRQIGIRETIRLVQSELVKVPVAVGWLKPVILLPIGIILQLTPEQLDGILWHELAHIRRRDYLVNILQGLVETVFFFNPGLLWLSALIRAEREACCDDMVLSQLQKKANYLEALLSFGFGEYKQPHLAMGIGSGNQLRDRLKRMISQENKRLSIAEKAVLSVGLILVSAFTAIPKNSAIARHLTINFNKPHTAAIQKSGSIDTVTIKQSVEGQNKPDVKLPDVKEIEVIKADTAIRFISVLFKNSDADWANNEFSAADDKGNKYHFIVAGGKIASMELNGVKIAEDKLPDYEYTLQYIISELMEKRRVRASDIAGFKANSPQAKYKDTVAHGADKKKYLLDEQKKKSWQSDDIRPKNADPGPAMMKSEAMRKRFSEDSINYNTELLRAQNVIADMVNDKVIGKPADVKWFGLSDSEFIVNGQKQPDEMQQRYKAKYGIHENYGLYYGPVQMHGIGVFIDAAMPGPRRGPRLVRPKRPGARYIGFKGTTPADTIAWSREQLINQQQAFAAKQNEKRQRLIEEQQRFLAEENAKREHIVQEQQHLVEQQRNFADEQNAKRRQIMLQQQASLDLQPAINGVIADLISASVIRDKSELVNFYLTNSALIVNGTKLPEEFHQRLKAKYLQQPSYPLKQDIMSDPNFGLVFETRNGGGGLGITIPSK